MEKIEIRPDFFVFRSPTASYQAEYISPPQEGKVVDGDKWRLSVDIWQTRNRGKPIQRTSRYPRHKRIGVFDSIEECEAYVIDYERRER